MANCLYIIFLNLVKIGHLSTIDAFLEVEQTEHAKKYILNLTDIDEKLEWMCQMMLLLMMLANCKSQEEEQKN